MKKTKKKLICLLAVFLMMGLVGCKQGKGIAVNGTIPEVPMIDIPKKEYPAANENLLTGIDDLSQEAIGKRPVAVMINNVEKALPQYGISQADVIFELPVEGNLTRLMALYGDYTAVPKVCAIRSCRYYYPALAKGFDAFYIHWGSDPTILDYVNSLNMDRYDGIANVHHLFGRDTDRRNKGYSLEHTGYFDGTKFADAVKADSKRTDLLESKKGTAFQFCKLNESIVPDGGACNRVHVKFGAATATLDYDEKNKTYKKQINGHDHIDGVTGETLSFTNVFVLETGIFVRDEAGHKKIDWAGSSNSVGYYISNGAMEKIHWSKENGSEGSYLRFYKETGEELVINRGKSYIAYTGSGMIDFK